MSTALHDELIEQLALRASGKADFCIIPTF